MVAEQVHPAPAPAADVTMNDEGRKWVQDRLTEIFAKSVRDHGESYFGAQGPGAADKDFHMDMLENFAQLRLQGVRGDHRAAAPDDDRGDGTGAEQQRTELEWH